MKIVLLEDIDNLGYAGDTKDVKAGYARNFLIPKKKALRATKANIKLIEAKRKSIMKKVEKIMEDAKAIQSSLNNVSIEIEARAGEKGKLFGSVTSADIYEKLKELNDKVDKKDIRLPEGGIKTVGEHKVEIAIYREIKAVVKVIVKAANEE